MSRGAPFDVAIVGASTAGCTAARLFGQAGARVALIEKRPDPDAYKVVCTHAILSSAAPTVERIGLAPLLRERGAVRTAGQAWTPFGGWIPLPEDVPRGWGVTRRTLDPMLRKLAADTSGVELITGRTVTRLLGDGVEAESPRHDTMRIAARLVVGADGRNSGVARLANVPGRVRPNNRFAYFAYWRGVEPFTDRARIWMLDPDGAAHFPNEDGLSLLAVVAHRRRLPEFREDLEGAYLRALEALPDGPDLTGAERVSKLIGSLRLENVIRPAAANGVAFVGDAALATDPLWGVGVGWAFQSAEWLADATAPALLDGAPDLEPALRSYRRRFLRELAPHHLLIADYSTGRSFTKSERRLGAAIFHDDALAAAFEEVVSRRRSPLRLLDPRLLPRYVRGVTAG
jgi:flavin-dependent dehydrogenase